MRMINRCGKTHGAPGSQSFTSISHETLKKDSELMRIALDEQIRGFILRDFFLNPCTLLCSHGLQGGQLLTEPLSQFKAARFNFRWMSKKHHVRDHVVGAECLSDDGGKFLSSFRMSFVLQQSLGASGNIGQGVVDFMACPVSQLL